MTEPRCAIVLQGPESGWAVIASSRTRPSCVLTSPISDLWLSFCPFQGYPRASIIVATFPPLHAKLIDQSHHLCGRERIRQLHRRLVQKNGEGQGIISEVGVKRLEAVLHADADVPVSDSARTFSFKRQEWEKKKAIWMIRMRQPDMVIVYTWLIGWLFRRQWGFYEAKSASRRE